MMADTNKRLADREIRVDLTDRAKLFVSQHGYDPVYGARPLKRYIQKYVETLSAKLILSGEVHEKDVIRIELKDGELDGGA